MTIIDAILFFIASGRPTPEEQKQATALSQKTGKTVIFRNASAVNRSDENTEACHGVAGKVPDAYKKLKDYSLGKAEKSLRCPEGLLDKQVAPFQFFNLYCRRLACFKNDRRGPTAALKAALANLVKAESLEMIPLQQLTSEFNMRSPIYYPGPMW